MSKDKEKEKEKEERESEKKRKQEKRLRKKERRQKTKYAGPTQKNPLRSPCCLPHPVNHTATDKTSVRLWVRTLPHSSGAQRLPHEIKRKDQNQKRTDKYRKESNSTQQHATARNSKAKPAQLVSKLQQRPAKERHSQKQRGSNNKNQHRKQTDTDDLLALAMLASPPYKP